MQLRVTDLIFQGEVFIPAGRLPEHPADIDLGVIASARHLDDYVRALVQAFGYPNIFIRLQKEENGWPLPNALQSVATTQRKIHPAGNGYREQTTIHHFLIVVFVFRSTTASCRYCSRHGKRV